MKRLNITDGYSVTSLSSAPSIALTTPGPRASITATARITITMNLRARVMAYDSATGNLTRRVVMVPTSSTQKMHSTRADLQGNVVVGGFYNELLTGVAYENYDLLRTGYAAL